MQTTVVFDQDKDFSLCFRNVVNFVDKFDYSVDNFHYFTESFHDITQLLGYLITKRNDLIHQALDFKIGINSVLMDFPKDYHDYLYKAYAISDYLSKKFS